MSVAVLPALMLVAMGCGDDGHATNRPTVVESLQGVIRAVGEVGGCLIATAELGRLDRVWASRRTLDEYYDSLDYQRQAIGPLRTLAGRCRWGTVEDRRRLAGLLTQFDALASDEESYREGLAAINEGLSLVEDCENLDRLVSWTSGHPEQESSVNRALAWCMAPSYRRDWINLKMVRKAAAAPLGGQPMDVPRQD